MRKVAYRAGTSKQGFTQYSTKSLFCSCHRKADVWSSSEIFRHCALSIECRAGLGAFWLNRFRAIARSEMRICTEWLWLQLPISRKLALKFLDLTPSRAHDVLADYLSMNHGMRKKVDRFVASAGEKRRTSHINVLVAER